MEQFLNSIKAVLYERTASPLFGAFVVSWLAWNYRAITILLSELPVLSKLSYIQTTLYPSWEFSIAFLLALPLLTSLLYLFLLPYPARFVHKFWRERQKELRDDRLAIEKATLLTVEESRRIRQNVLDVQTDYDRALRHLQADLDRNKELLQQRVQDVERLQAELLRARSSTLKEDHAVIIEEAALDTILRTRPFRLYHNPKLGRDRSKTMMFGPGGKILEGGNKQESSWRLANGKLELLQSDGQVHTRFSYDPRVMLFIDTNDSDTRSIVKGKFMIPEPESAKPTEADA